MRAASTRTGPAVTPFSTRFSRRGSAPHVERVLLPVVAELVVDERQRVGQNARGQRLEPQPRAIRLLHGEFELDVDRKLINRPASLPSFSVESE